MYLGELEVWIYLDGYCRQFILAAECFDERAQIFVHKMNAAIGAALSQTAFLVILTKKKETVLEQSLLRTS
jgi:hypothetical protein